MLQGEGEGRKFWELIAKAEKLVEQINKERGGGWLPPALAPYNPYKQENSECPSCGGLNISCPDGCGRDPITGELNFSRLENSDER